MKKAKSKALEEMKETGDELKDAPGHGKEHKKSKASNEKVCKHCGKKCHCE